MGMVMLMVRGVIPPNTIQMARVGYRLALGMIALCGKQATLSTNCTAYTG